MFAVTTRIQLHHITLLPGDRQMSVYSVTMVIRDLLFVLTQQTPLGLFKLGSFDICIYSRKSSTLKLLVGIYILTKFDE